jgi:hypothetical protein
MRLLFWCSILLLCLYSYGQNPLPPTSRYLAAECCYIEDYAKWLKEQENLEKSLRFARIFDVHPTNLKKQSERYHLQRECLNIVARLSILVGGE